MGLTLKNRGTADDLRNTQKESQQSHSASLQKPVVFRNRFTNDLTMQPKRYDLYNGLVTHWKRFGSVAIFDRFSDRFQHVFKP